MPSEMIYSRKQDIDVRVAWGNDGSETIQIATLVAQRMDNDPTERVITIVNEWLDAAKLPKIDLAELRKRLSETPPFFDGFHATLDDWSSVNALIRVLKRARDKSFGPPE